MSVLDLTRERAELTRLQVDAKALYAQMESSPALRTSENTERLDKMIEDGLKLNDRISRLSRFDSIPEGGGDAKAGAAGSETVPAPAGGDGAAAQPLRKSWGALVLDSEEYKTAAKNWTAGKMAGVKVGDAKAVTSTPASGGFLYRPQREAEIIDTARQRPFSILDVITRGETSVDSIEYVEMSSRTNNAGVVPELDAARTHVAAGSAEAIAADNGNFQENFAMKPKGDLLFALKSALVKTIAEWIPASRQILMDAPRLRGTIDDELTYMLRVKLEDMIVAANETGFVGILNAPGIQTRTHRVAGRGFTAEDKIADTLRRMVTDVQMAFYEGDTFIVSPEVAEAVELEKDDVGRYLAVFDPVTQRVFRKAVVVSNALNNAHRGTAIYGNLRLAATLWDRMDVEIRVGEPGNFFLQNAVAVLGELRAAFAVTRPLALEKALALIP